MTECKRPVIAFEDFDRVDVRSGVVVRAEPFPRARKPAYKVWVDFGPEYGILQTSAQVTVHYTPESLVGRHVIGCLNPGERNIAGFMSQFLLLGVADAGGAVVLLAPDRPVPPGQKMA
jgi:tRNA-binding protein